MKTSMRLMACTLSIVVLFACTKDEKSAPVRFMLTDNPASYDSVNIHIKGIRIKMNNDSAGWINIHAKDTVVNLLTLQNGVTTVISQDTIPVGILKEVRFILGDDNYVVVSGNRFPLAAPSAETSGLKIKIDKHLDENLNSFILDFDVAESIKESNGNYKLMPVIKLK
jgi:hypothetical protein